MEEQIISVELFSNFFSTASTIIILKSDLEEIKIKELLKQFPNGISDYSQYPELVMSPIQNDDCFLILSPLKASGKTLYNLQQFSNIQTATLIGNCGIRRTISKYPLTCYLDPIDNILPFFYISSIMIMYTY